MNEPARLPLNPRVPGLIHDERPEMPLYEHVLLARQDVTSQQVETMIDTYKGVIEQNGGRLEKIEMWGVKSLAYRIKKNRKAHFALLNIDAPPAAIAEMERQMQISEDILRFMTIRVEELEQEPSAMMQKRDRDDRRDRERGRRRDDEGFGGGFGGDRGDRGDRPERGERPERNFGGEN
ncbi:hypothetical protein GCM10007886_14470 [Methylobacterium gregans]|nr:hypothetical protein GCM10007886_14470 [Methylobacterium gregans]